MPVLVSTGCVYLFRLSDFHKIGSTTDLRKRMLSFQTLPFPFELVHHFPSLDAHAVEKCLHFHFHPRRVKGEWFCLTPEDIAALKSLLRVDRVEDLPAELQVDNRFRGDRHRQPRYAFHLEHDLLRALDHYCSERQPVPDKAEVVRLAIREFLEREGRWPPRTAI